MTIGSEEAPEELAQRTLLEKVLDFCENRELGCLYATCSYFTTTTIVHKIAQCRISAIPRARGLQPAFSKRETWLSLLHFITSQSRGAAQGTAISLGAYHTAGLFVSNAMSAEESADSGSSPHYELCTFGRGFHGQLGNADYSAAYRPVECCNSSGGNFLSKHNGQPAVVACGSNHSILISRRGELFTWGLASSGELGHSETPIDLNVPRQVASLNRTRIVSVSAGGNHTLAISEAGELWACGRGRHGQLGLGTFEDQTLLRKVTSLQGIRVVSAAAGERHSVALGSHGCMYTWGCGRHGQLGLENVADFVVLNPAAPVAVHQPQRVSSLDPNNLHPWDRITAVAAGLNHTVALTVAGDIFMCGHNKHGALGLGDTVNRFLPTKVDLSRTVAMTGKVDQAGAPGMHLARGVQVACGGMHTLALVKIRGQIIVCAAGYNAHGQLGTGDTTRRLFFTPVEGLEGVSAVCVVSGEHHCCVVSRRGDLHMWGRGDIGQLGLGDDFSRSIPTLLPDHRVVNPDRTLRRQPPSRVDAAR
ncbi:g4904 [Coccomyxa elongata]